MKYVENENPAAEFTVELADGVYATGFLMYGSEDYSDARQSNYRTSLPINRQAFLPQLLVLLF